MGWDKVVPTAELIALLEIRESQLTDSLDSLIYLLVYSLI